MDPLTLVYLALMAAGTAAQGQAVAKVDRESAKAQLENRTIREKREQDSKALAEDSANAVLQTREKQGQRAKELAAEYTKPQESYDASGRSAVTGLLDPTLTGESTTTIDAANSAAAKSKREGDFNAQLRGQMDSYGSVMNDANTRVSQNAGDVRRNEKSMNDWTNFVLPMKLAAASQSGRNWSTAGDVLKLAAMVTGMHALAKAPEAATSTVETPDIGAQIAASKGPSWLPAGESFGKYAPEMASGGAGAGAGVFGSNFGQAAAQKGWLDAWGLGEPAAKAVGPLRSGFVQPQGNMIGADGMFNPLFWLKAQKPISPIMY